MKKTLILVLILFASRVACLADVLVGTGKSSKTEKKIEFILEYSEDREALATVLTKEGKKIAIPVVGIGALYLNGDRKHRIDFFIMKFGGSHDSLTGFYVYPGGYAAFLRVDLFKKEKPFVLYDDILAEYEVVLGSIDK